MGSSKSKILCYLIVLFFCGRYCAMDQQHAVYMPVVGDPLQGRPGTPKDEFVRSLHENGSRVQHYVQRFLDDEERAVKADLFAQWGIAPELYDWVTKKAADIDKERELFDVTKAQFVFASNVPTAVREKICATAKKRGICGRVNVDGAVDDSDVAKSLACVSIDSFCPGDREGVAYFSPEYSMHINVSGMKAHEEDAVVAHEIEHIAQQDAIHEQLLMWAIAMPKFFGNPKKISLFVEQKTNVHTTGSLEMRKKMDAFDAQFYASESYLRYSRWQEMRADILPASCSLESARSLEHSLYGDCKDFDHLRALQKRQFRVAEFGRWLGQVWGDAFIAGLVIAKPLPLYCASLIGGIIGMTLLYQERLSRISRPSYFTYSGRTHPDYRELCRLATVIRELKEAEAHIG